MAHGKNQSINVTNIDGDANNQLTSTGDGRTNKSNTHATNIQDLGVPEGNINNATLYLYIFILVIRLTPVRMHMGSKAH